LEEKEKKLGSVRDERITGALKKEKEQKQPHKRRG